MQKNKNYVLSVGVISILIISTLIIITPYKADASVFLGASLNCGIGPRWVDQIGTIRVGVRNMGDEWASGVNIILDYDETQLTILSAKGMSACIEYHGIDNGDTITWSGVRIPFPPSSFTSDCAAMMFSASVKYLIDECVPTGTQIESKLFWERDGHRYGPKKGSIEVINPNICGFFVDQKVKQISEETTPSTKEFVDEIQTTQGETLKFKTELKNIGDFKVFVYDVWNILPPDLEYISGTGKVNGKNREPGVKEIIDGRTKLGWKFDNLEDTKSKLNKILKGETLTIEFNALVTEKGEFISKFTAMACTGDKYSYYKSIPISDKSYVLSGNVIPLLVYNPTSLDFGVVPPGKTATKSFEIWNGLNGILYYSLSEYCSWLTISTTSGESTGEKDTINVEIDTTGLSGDQSCDIYIDSNEKSAVLTAHVTVGSSSGGSGESEEESEEDDPVTETGDPTISILSPISDGLYINSKRIFTIGRTLIFGPLIISASATDSDGIVTKVEFYIDDELKETLTSGPYEYEWDEKTIGKSVIKVIAYDNEGNTGVEEMSLFMINFGNKGD